MQRSPPPPTQEQHRGCTWRQERGADASSARGPTSHSRSLGCSSAPAPAVSRVPVTGGSAGHLFSPRSRSGRTQGPPSPPDGSGPPGGVPCVTQRARSPCWEGSLLPKGSELYWHSLQSLPRGDSGAFPVGPGTRKGSSVPAESRPPPCRREGIFLASPARSAAGTWEPPWIHPTLRQGVPAACIHTRSPAEQVS